jgi:large subunit ribosomal protein L23
MAIFNRKTKTSDKENTEEVKAPVKKTVKKAVKKEEGTEEKKRVVKSGFSELAMRVNLKPLVTEKSAHLGDDGVYAFEVKVSANRTEVRDAFREIYKIVPVKVNIIRVHGKEKRFGRFQSRASDWKKALVTVPANTKIDLFTL